MLKLHLKKNKTKHFLKIYCMCVLGWGFRDGADGAHVRTHVWIAESVLSFLFRLVNFSLP